MESQPPKPSEPDNELRAISLSTADPEEAFQTLIRTVQSYMPNADLGILRKAFDFASGCHKGQNRSSGEPYITHPVAVATITASMKIDLASVVAALLHDVVEDTVATLADIEKEFGKTVADLVDGLTKISKIEFRSNQEVFAENFRKMVMAMAKDLRVILVKLADRLHNMRTLKGLTQQKRTRVAQETLDIYAPLANRLGIYNIKSELEDLCLRHLKADVYEELKQKIQAKKTQRIAQIEEVRLVLHNELKKYEFQNFEVTGRPKHFYSIYKKMVERQLNFEDIHDLFAFRIIVDNIKDCYEALGIVHAMWKPMPGRFKDYIAMPKANMYQSLHTTVIRPNGEPAEIQIRTHAMHEICEFGVAAHWNYKEKGSSIATPMPNADLQKLAWLKQIVEWQNELTDPGEFLEAVRVDLFEDEIFVFTPKGDVIRLPVSATTLDFAFGVHTAVGLSTVGAKVNGRMVPIRKTLKSGDIVEIVTSPKQRPSKDWLSFVTTSKAKNRIRAFLRVEEREKSKKLGLELLQQEFSERQLEAERLTRSNDQEALIKGGREANWEDLLVGVGYGRINAKELVAKIYPEKAKPLTSQEVETKTHKVTKTGRGKGILVSGLENILVHFGRCCSPLPGEDIVGFITRGRGVTIHRGNCPRIFDMDPQRRVEVTWGQGVPEGHGDFITHLTVDSRDRPGILADVTLVLSNAGANILKAQVHVGKDLIARLNFDIAVKSHSQLQAIIQKIEKIPSILRIERRMEYPKTPSGSRRKK